MDLKTTRILSRQPMKQWPWPRHWRVMNSIMNYDSMKNFGYTIVDVKWLGNPISN